MGGIAGSGRTQEARRKDPRIDGLVFRQPGCFPSFDFDWSGSIGDHEVELRRSICRSLHSSADANARLLHRQIIKILLHLVLGAVRSLADDEQKPRSDLCWLAE